LAAILSQGEPKGREGKERAARASPMVAAGISLTERSSIRVNDQWRVIFKWIDDESHEVQIIDYH